MNSVEEWKKDFKEYVNGLSLPRDDYKGIMEYIDEVPTQGEWISHYDYCEKHGYNPSALIAFWWCERCGQAVEHPTNFCPNCGARMKDE